jgi:RecQ family ATP-dependent DNA helicase
LLLLHYHFSPVFSSCGRPDYKQLNVLKNRFPDVPIIALTATATQQVIEDVQKILRIERSIIFKSPFNRPNLNYSVRIKKDQAKAVLTDIANLIETEYHNATGIIYCFSKKECETVAEFMSASGIKSSAYHADMTPQQRERAHKAWYKGSIKVVVATVAFGMGINKPDVRFVIHHSMAKSIEVRIKVLIFLSFFH